MFDFLNELPLDELTSGVHYAVRRLSHPATLVRAIDDVTPGDRRVASRVLDAINEVEGRSWKPGEGDVVDKYIQELSRIVQARTLSGLIVNPERGRRLLDKVRERIANESGRD